jgi:hypothetical protein
MLVRPLPSGVKQTVASGSGRPSSVTVPPTTPSGGRSDFEQPAAKQAATAVAAASETRSVMGGVLQRVRTG